jgi:hypothetical protein
MNCVIEEFLKLGLCYLPSDRKTAAKIMASNFLRGGATTAPKNSRGKKQMHDAKNK